MLAILATSGSDNGVCGGAVTGLGDHTESMQRRLERADAGRAGAHAGAVPDRDDLEQPDQPLLLEAGGIPLPVTAQAVQAGVARWVDIAQSRHDAVGTERHRHVDERLGAGEHGETVEGAPLALGGQSIAVLRRHHSSP